MNTKITHPEQPSKSADLLAEMANQAYTPKVDPEEHYRKLYEDMCKRLSRAELTIACRNWNRWMDSKLNQTA